MTYIADRFVVILDANVLYPFRTRDILLSFYKAGLFRARWTDDIVREWCQSLLEEKPQLEESLSSQRDAMRRRFDDAWVTGYERLIPALELPDANDRHVLAAAILCGAQHIITENVRDFPAEALDPFDIEAVQADEFLARTFDLYPSEATRALNEVRARYRNPPYSKAEFIMDLIAKKLPKLATKARQL